MITCRVSPAEARCWLSEPGSSHPENETEETSSSNARKSLRSALNVTRNIASCFTDYLRSGCNSGLTA